MVLRAPAHGRRSDLSDLDGILSALADPTRRGVVDLLREGPRRPGDLAEALDASAPAMSRHLRVLKKSGLVREELGQEDARVRMYSLQREPFDALEAWVEDVQSFWTMELAAFKAHAEKTRGRKKKK